jgi:hypothetical protein
MEKFIADAFSSGLVRATTITTTACTMTFFTTTSTFTSLFVSNATVRSTTDSLLAGSSRMLGVVGFSTITNHGVVTLNLNATLNVLTSVNDSW